MPSNLYQKRIKTEARKQALGQHHPDKHSRAKKNLQKKNDQKNSSALAILDADKPTIVDFFLSLQQKLTHLEKKIIGVYPNPLEKPNKTYPLKCIEASYSIASVLQNYINTTNKTLSKIPPDLKKLKFLLLLREKFLIFHFDGHLQIQDAHTLELAQLLLHHFAFLRNPLRSFKSTEDYDQLQLLDEASPCIKHYYNKLKKKQEWINLCITIQFTFNKKQKTYSLFKKIYNQYDFNAIEKEMAFKLLNQLSFLEKIYKSVDDYKKRNPPTQPHCFFLSQKSVGEKRVDRLFSAAENVFNKMNKENLKNHEDAFNDLIQLVETITSGEDYHFIHSSRLNGLDTILKQKINKMTQDNELNMGQLALAEGNYFRYKNSFFRYLKPMSDQSLKAKNAIKKAGTNAEKFIIAKAYISANPRKAYAIALCNTLPTLAKVT